MTTTKPQNRLLDQFPPHTYEEWKEAAVALLKGAPFDKKLITPTYEGFLLQPIYRREDLATCAHISPAPALGSQVRGTRPEGYLENPWKISQELPFSTPKEFNQAAVPDVERGQNELNILLDLAAQSGIDPDSSVSGNVGSCGLSLASLEDLETAFENLPLDSLSIYFQSGIVSLPVAGLFLALARKRGVAFEQLTGCFATDPLGHLSWSASIPVSLDRVYRDMSTLTKFAAKHLPGMQTIEVNTNAYHNGGGNASDEVAFALATAAEYLRAMQSRGLEPEIVARKLRFSMAIGSQFFPEIAKFRAARLLWTQVFSAFAPESPAPCFYLHARTGMWNKTRLDPYVNMLRTTTEAFSAVMGGCDSMHVGPFDEIFRVPDTFSRRIARNTHLILAEECDLTRTIDPAGGSYAVEVLTDQIARQAWRTFQEIEGAGGMAQALADGVPQQKVAAVRTLRDKSLAQRREIIVGTNTYPNADETLAEPTTPDYSKIHRIRGEEVAEFRTSDASGSHNSVLNSLEAILKAGSDSLMEPVIEAASTGATLGEISRTLWSGDRTPLSLPPVKIARAAQPFEILRKRITDAGPPEILQANMGPSRAYRARADWTSSFFQVGGFKVLNETDFTSPEEAEQAAIQKRTPIVVICSTDETYLELVPDLAKALKALDFPPTIMVAGAPGDNESTWKEAGVDDFVHIRVNCFEMLSQLADLTAPKNG